MQKTNENLEIGDKTYTTKSWACRVDKVEAVIMPFNPLPNGQPQEVLVVCPQCLSAIKLRFLDFQAMMRSSNVSK